MRRVHMLYTEEEGGAYHCIAKDTDQETIDFYNLCVAKGMIEHYAGSKIIRVTPVFMMLARNFEEWDRYAPKKEAAK